MRVLHLLGATEDDGGILTVLRGLATQHAPSECYHVVWVHRSYREIRRPHLEYRPSRWFLGEPDNHWSLGLRSLPAILELARLQQRERYDLLHLHARGGLLIAPLIPRLLRQPILFTNHGYANRVEIYRWAMRRQAVHTVLLSPAMVRHYGAAALPRVSVISACCQERFFEAPLVTRRTSPQGPLRLVGVGNVVAWKNWHLVLEALLQLTVEERARVRFDHFGPVPDTPPCRAYAERLRRLRSELGNGVTFHGPSHQIVEVLREADWFVLPSTNEPCSVALIEALALGLPALASASGGNVDIIHNARTGLLFEPNSVTSLAQRLRAILHHPVPPAAPEEMRETVRQRGAPAVAAEYLVLYRRLLAEAISSRA